MQIKWSIVTRFWLWCCFDKNRVCEHSNKPGWKCQCDTAEDVKLLHDQDFGSLFQLASQKSIVCVRLFKPDKMEQFIEPTFSPNIKKLVYVVLSIIFGTSGFYCQNNKYGAHTSVGKKKNISVLFKGPDWEKSYWCCCWYLYGQKVI